ncbi:guanylate kinase [Candidatus Similichlamydia laticola]|uniref:Guanylate kinase n=1 Tax=Candidatus Similichlamydia laticola TaxID=2170265 RepID=A0A369KHZ5_9BACT|nr:guanylate kinase [Candidatus Similichlamydia laticola]RDB31413.1 Guanylate kinase [Candidatus Similichlamydia laticola]
MKRQKLFVLSGPSGVGKTTLVQNLLVADTSVKRLVTCTTRAPRSNEQEGIDYFFMSRGKFQGLIDQGLLAEWEEIHGNYYGVLKSQIDSLFAEGLAPIANVGVQGAFSLSALYPCVLIFLEPPSPEALETRLLKRGEEDRKIIELRLEKGKEVMTFRDRYDYTIVCDDLTSAFDLLQQIVRKERE